MAFLLEPQELKDGLIIFRRGDVKHRKWYCRIKLPNADRYKTVCLKTTDVDAAKERAFDEDADLRFRIKHDVPIFNRPFSAVAKDFLAVQEVRAKIGDITAKRLETMDSAIYCQLNTYVGSVQINQLGKDRWTGYPTWRRLDALERKAVEDERQARLREAEQANDKREMARLRAAAPRDRKGRIRLPTGVLVDQHATHAVGHTAALLETEASLIELGAVDRRVPRSGPRPTSASGIARTSANASRPFFY